jgi:hypothetical protein
MGSHTAIVVQWPWVHTCDNIEGVKSKYSNKTPSHFYFVHRNSTIDSRRLRQLWRRVKLKLMSSAGLSKDGARWRSLWRAPKSYCAEQKKGLTFWDTNVSYKIIIKSVRELCVVSRCVFLKIANARIRHERGARLRQIDPVGLRPALLMRVHVMVNEHRVDGYNNSTIGNRTRDLPAWSAMPQPTAPTI